MKQLDWQIVDQIISNALQEDLGPGDVTTERIFEATETASAFMLAKDEGVIAGLPVAQRVFQKLDPDIIWETAFQDGQEIQPDDVLLKISGSRRALLSGERLALNFLQHLSGIATLTAAFVRAVEGTGVKILDTRKTIPGLRMLEKYAVAMGGAQNHRLGLYDGIMIKDNHIKLAGGILNAVKRLKSTHSPQMPIEIETASLAEVQLALQAGADIIMLDNMPPEMMREAVRLIRPKARIEASGGVTLETVRDIAETGIDFISVGALTHSLKALDIGLYFHD